MNPSSSFLCTSIPSVAQIAFQARGVDAVREQPFPFEFQHRDIPFVGVVPIGVRVDIAFDHLDRHVGELREDGAHRLRRLLAERAVGAGIEVKGQSVGGHW